MVISDATRAEIQAAIARYPSPAGALLPALHSVQRQLGHVPPDAVAELAELLGIPPIRIREVISFYNMFHDRPVGRHCVNVCTNLPCSLRGARGLLRALEAHLGIRVGETTPDGRISLGHEECLGGCGYAPVVRVDDRYEENLDLEQAKRLVDSLE